MNDFPLLKNAPPLLADSIAPKLMLLCAAHHAGIRVVSSMGAGEVRGDGRGGDVFVWGGEGRGEGGAGTRVVSSMGAGEGGREGGEGMEGGEGR